MKQKRFGSRWDEDEAPDPMSGVANLADIMLVFACGLMVALVLHWGVSLAMPSKLEEDQLKAVTDSDMFTDEELVGEQYQPEGTVYRDTETGKLYIVSP